MSGALVYMCACDALSIERVVICKSALPRAGGVKLGKGGRNRRRDGTGARDRHRACMRGV